MKIEKYGSRNWAVFDDDGSIICVTVYKKGAREVVRRLSNTAIVPLTVVDTEINKIIELSKELKCFQKKLNNLADKIKAAENPPLQAII